MISIITVVYKDYNGLMKTLKSVERQSAGRKQVEYIVVDGGSRCHKTDEIAEMDVVDLYLSEPDMGIYDAMNKGINLANGEWLFFLNAGDTLFDKHTLNKVLAEIDGLPCDINLLYGSYCVNGVQQSQDCTLKFLSSHMLNHQSIFYHRSLLVDGYDIRYRFCADYAHLLSVWQSINAKSLDVCIANFDTSGVSSLAHNKARMWQERICGIWRSQLSLRKKLFLSFRGIFAWPYHYVKSAIIKGDVNG